MKYGIITVNPETPLVSELDKFIDKVMTLEYDYYLDFWKEKCKKGNLKGVYVIHTDDGIIGWFCIDRLFKTLWLQIVYILPEYSMEAMKFLSSLYPNSIFSGFEYDFMINAGFVECSMDHTDGHYSCPSPYPFTNGEKDIFVKAFENEFLWGENDSVENLHFVDMSTEEIAKKVHTFSHPVGIPCSINKYGHNNFPGFHYFSGGNDFSYYNCNEKVRFLLAIGENNKIAGVIRYGEWPYTQGITSIAYIDVTKNARQKGVARRLAKELYNRIDHSKPFALGRLSDMGAMCKIDEVFKAEMPDINFVD